MWLPWGDILGSSSIFLPHKNCHTSTHPQPLHIYIYIPFPCPYLVPGSIAGFAKPNNKMLRNAVTIHVSSCHTLLWYSGIRYSAIPSKKSCQMMARRVTMLLSSLHLASTRSACEGCVRISFFLPKLAVILASPFALVCICPWQRKVHLQPQQGHSVWP